ncbi:DNA-processing protein DprA [Ruminococcus sp.]|uniref:DNA-processing protein DprA n=1 Tax=Ruminococcus sp. TaxID=41978 RepID=UPI002D1D072F|nr:DNA-processing protein DprA [Ruminococcus sp.]HNZ98553.1 DNA-processing protein DprA [Ruminococcus sp.]HOH86908.1 DNA-processing protein DprA [Ruminococcus sp.]
MEDTKYWLWLNMVFGTGNHRIWEVMSFFRTAEKAYISLTTDSGIVSLNEAERKNVNSIPLRNAEIYLANCAKRGIGAVAFTDPDYPEQLKHIYNPPSLLYYKGNISCLKTELTVTSVGTRKATPYSLKAAKEICSELSARGAVIISGFAVGIDLASHMAAADIGRPTVCVMGCGVDVDYPKPNFQYRDIILAAGGVFISEFPPGTPPNSPNFPKRNRVLAALGAAAVVFQAGAKSGSLITANLAAGQGREVLCLPPADIFSGEFAGNVKLLRDGALPMYDASDVMDCITGKKKKSAETYAVRRGAEVFGETREPSNDELNDLMRALNGIDEVKKEPAESTEQPELPDDLSETQRRIAEELLNGALHADELAQRLELDPSVLMTELTELEIFGTVRSLPGKMFELIR